MDVSKSNSTITGYKVALRFKIGLLNPDKTLLENINAYLGCGVVRDTTNFSYISVYKLKQHLDIFIPLMKMPFQE